MKEFGQSIVSDKLYCLSNPIFRLRFETRQKSKVTCHSHSWIMLNLWGEYGCWAQKWNPNWRPTLDGRKYTLKTWDICGKAIVSFRCWILLRDICLNHGFLSRISAFLLGCISMCDILVTGKSASNLEAFANALWPSHPVFGAYACSSLMPIILASVCCFGHNLQNLASSWSEQFLLKSADWCRFESWDVWMCSHANLQGCYVCSLSPYSLLGQSRGLWRGLETYFFWRN